MATDMRIARFRQALEGVGANPTAIRVLIENDDGDRVPRPESVATIKRLVERVAAKTGDDPQQVAIDQKPTLTDEVVVEGPGRLLWELAKQMEVGGIGDAEGPQAHLC